MYEYLDRRYALALYEIAEKNGKVDEYIRELKEILNLIKTSDELLSVVKHPEITTSQKKRVFKSIFKGKVDDYILGFLLILIEKDRILYLEEKLMKWKRSI